MTPDAPADAQQPSDAALPPIGSPEFATLFVQRLEQRAVLYGNRCLIDTDFHVAVSLIGAVQLAMRHPDLDRRIYDQLNELVRSLISAIAGGDPVILAAFNDGLNTRSPASSNA